LELRGYVKKHVLKGSVGAPLLTGLSSEELIDTDGFEVKPRIQKDMAKKIISNIEASKSRGFARVLASLGIPKIGVYWAEEYASRFPSADELCKASQNELKVLFAEKEPRLPGEIVGYLSSSEGKAALAETKGYPFTAAYIRKLQIPDVGAVRATRIAESGVFGDWDEFAAATPMQIAQSLNIAWPEYEIAEGLYAYLHEEQGQTLLAELASLGVSLEHRDVTDVQSGLLAGKKVAVTGGLPGMTRKEFGQAVAHAGGKLTNSVTAATDILVVGDNPGREKLEKAQKLGIREMAGTELLASMGIDIQCSSLSNGPKASKPRGDDGQPSLF
jgi:NAD-dependent DNA ligase